MFPYPCWMSVRRHSLFDPGSSVQETCGQRHFSFGGMQRGGGGDTCGQEALSRIQAPVRMAVVGVRTGAACPGAEGISGNAKRVLFSQGEKCCRSDAPPPLQAWEYYARKNRLEIFQIFTIGLHRNGERMKDPSVQGDSNARCEKKRFPRRSQPSLKPGPCAQAIRP